MKISATTAKILLTTDPIPQPRARYGKGRVYQPARVVEYKNQIKAAAVAAGVKPIEGALCCSIRLYRKYQPTSRRYGDCDNHIKSVLDALNGVAFVDDSQITRCVVEKMTADNPAVEIEITAAD